MYRYIATFGMSNLTGLSLKKTLCIMMKTKLNITSVELVLFIDTWIRVFNPTLQRGESRNWHIQSDQTHHLSQFEQLALRSSNSFFFVSLHRIITVDDEMMGARAGDYQLRSISSRKVAPKGLKEDYIADSISPS